MSWLALAGVLACSVGAPSDPSPPEEQVILRENAQGALSGVSVGVGNLWERDYPLPDGSTRRGLSAQLFVGGERRVIVGAGSELQLGSSVWLVRSVDKPSGEEGQVRLVPAASAKDPSEAP